jgi:nicotinamidase-related amidase/tRNA(Arg) A34 adenosine deaminase TadA
MAEVQHQPPPAPAVARQLLGAALSQARRSRDERGAPVGAVLATGDGEILGAGSNRVAQDGDALLHAEIVAVRNAGGAADLRTAVLVTTVEPCWLCAGMIRFFEIPTVIIGRTTEGARADWLRSSGVEVIELADTESRELLEAHRTALGIRAVDRDSAPRYPLEQMRDMIPAPMTVAKWTEAYRLRLVDVPVADTILLIIDMQNGFCTDEHFMGIAPSAAPFRAAVPGCVELAELARAAGIPVCYTRIAYLPGFADRLPSRGWKTGTMSTLFDENAPETAIVDELTPQAGDLVIDKVRPGALYGTRLEPWLTATGVRNIVLAGVTTSICVETTAREAHARGYNVYVVDEATAEAEGSRQVDALYTIDWVFGTVCQVSDVARSWSTPTLPPGDLE